MKYILDLNKTIKRFDKLPNIIPMPDQNHFPISKEPSFIKETLETKYFQTNVSKVEELMSKQVEFIHDRLIVMGASSIYILFLIPNKHNNSSSVN